MIVLLKNCVGST